MYRIYLISCLVLVRGGPARIDKDQFCTDPRTMAQHPAYTEWADAYSCTRHRCQPGGRNLAIYTVGCKRVEAPESAIECEEVVEDTNMQFPYCCTRLRCLVVVRGEVWTRVLGQPWETLPAAPWSHMYKMKKPPPVEAFHKKGIPAGPVYELTDPTDKQTQDSGPVMRATRDDNENCEKPVARAAAATPDIVIALTTKDKKTNIEESRPSSSFRAREKQFKYGRPVERESFQHNEIEPEEERYNEKDISDEQAYSVPDNSHQKTRNEVSEENYPSEAEQNIGKDSNFADVSEEKEKPSSNTGSLQTLVDAIGTRMRDIENVVQRMSEQVPPPEDNLERARLDDRDGKNLEAEVLGKETRTISDDYDRISPHHNRYLRTEEHTTEKPIFMEDPHLRGYFSDPSNNMRRSNRPKERPDMFGTRSKLIIRDSYPCSCATNDPLVWDLAHDRRALGAEFYEPPLETYMAPIDTNHRITDAPEFDDKTKHKKHTHKKKKSKHGKKKHRRADRENFNNIPTSDIDKNGLSLENNSFGTA